MEREVEITINAKDDIEYFKKSGQNKNLKKIRRLIESIVQTPFEGLGQPEPVRP